MGRLIPDLGRLSGRELRIVTNKPERVGIWQIYQHLRRQETTCTDMGKEIGGDMAQSKVQESVSPTDANGLSLAVGRIELGLTEIKAKLDSLDHLREMTALQEDDPSFTVKQVAMKLQVSTSKVYQLTESGKLKSYKTGNQVRIKASLISDN